MSKLKNSLPGDTPRNGDGFDAPVLVAIFVSGLFVVIGLMAGALALRASTPDKVAAAPLEVAAAPVEVEQLEAPEEPATTIAPELPIEELGLRARLGGVIPEVSETTISDTTIAPETPAPAKAEPPAEAPPTAAPAPADPPAGGPSAEGWAKLRDCEAGGRYNAVNPAGYYGAYQFNQGTWNSVASSAGRADLVGVLPSKAAPADQDALAFALYESRGAQPWPTCGRHLK